MEYFLIDKRAQIGFAYNETFSFDKSSSYNLKNDIPKNYCRRNNN